MTVRWIGQSGYIIKSGKTEIIIDPYLSDIVNKMANRPRLVPSPIDPENIHADAVICTHAHVDHLDPDAVPKMSDNIHYITTNEGKEIIRGFGMHNVTAVNEGDRLTVGDLNIYAVYAHHTVDAVGIVIEAEGKRLYFSGDTLYDEKLFGLSKFKPDITFICINGKLGNMNVNEALTTAKKIGASVNIPNHYGMFASNTEDPHKFVDNIKGGFIMEFNREYNIKEIFGDKNV